MEKSNNSPDIDSSPQVSRNKTWLIVLLGIVLVCAVAGGVYYWQQQQAKKQASELQSQIDNLKKQVADAEKKATEEEAEKTAEKTCKTLSATQLENVHAAIDSKNTAALEGLLAAKVQYVLAASEMGKDVTPAEAIQNLEYLKPATSPWNWNIAAATLNQYKAGDYKQYLADDTIFGASANKYFISMRDNCGKIDQIFVASSTDLL